MSTEGHVSAHLGRFLKGLEFPAGQHDLLESARQNGADQGVLEVLGKMPQREYESMAEVMEFYRKTA
jgi:Protein of unknown function (DUF2795)